jgi:hypothetical protein
MHIRWKGGINLFKPAVSIVVLLARPTELRHLPAR